MTADFIRALGKALYQAAADKPKLARESVIERAVALLHSKHLLNKGHQLLASLSDAHRQAQDIVLAKVATARPLRQKQLNELKNFLEKRFKKSIELAVTVDPNRIGGIRIVCEDVALDASLAYFVKQMTREILTD